MLGNPLGFQFSAELTARKSPWLPHYGIVTSNGCNFWKKNKNINKKRHVVNVTTSLAIWSGVIISIQQNRLLTAYQSVYEYHYHAQAYIAKCVPLISHVKHLILYVNNVHTACPWLLGTVHSFPSCRGMSRNTACTVVFNNKYEFIMYAYVPTCEYGILILKMKFS